MTHNLKIALQFADAVISKEKTFEVRNNDRAYQKGDHVRFTAVVGTGSYATKVPDHPINDKEYEITYVLSGWGIKEDYVVFAMQETEAVNEEKD